MASAWGKSWGKSWGNSWGSVVEATLDIIHGPNNRNWRTDWENEQYRKAKERERIKQDEIIRLKLEAQEVTVEKKDLAKQDASKQRDKQLQALSQKLDELNLIIQQENAKLAVIQQKLVVYRHNMAFVALIAANPFWGGRA
jgi:hypothetical protein